MKQRILCLVCSVLLVLTVAGCTEGAVGSTPTTVTTATTATAETTTETDETTAIETTVAETEAATTTETATTTTTTTVSTTATTAATTTTKATTTTTTTTTKKSTTTTTTTATTTTKAQVKCYTARCPSFMSDVYFNEDGSLNFGLLVEDAVHSIDYEKYFTHEDTERMYRYYKIPEKVILQAMRKTYAVANSYFEKLKQQGSYNIFGPDDLSYADGFFTYGECTGGWGGGGTWSDVIGYHDDKNGTLTVYHDFFMDAEHAYYLKTTYTYTGQGELAVCKPDGEEFWDGYIRSDSSKQLASLRIVSVEKVTKLPAHSPLAE